MWLVGYIELDRDVYFYAMNFTTRDYEETRHARYDIILNILKSLKLIE
jgi:beta-lactamase class D